MATFSSQIKKQVCPSQFLLLSLAISAVLCAHALAQPTNFDPNNLSGKELFERQWQPSDPAAHHDGLGPGPYLHDGRASNLHEAILWHGGEARLVRDRCLSLSDNDKRMLLMFLESLVAPNTPQTQIVSR